MQVLKLKALNIAVWLYEIIMFIYFLIETGAPDSVCIAKAQFPIDLFCVLLTDKGHTFL